MREIGDVLRLSAAGSSYRKSRPRRTNVMGMTGPANAVDRGEKSSATPPRGTTYHRGFCRWSPSAETGDRGATDIGRPISMQNGISPIPPTIRNSTLLSLQYQKCLPLIPVHAPKSSLLLGSGDLSTAHSNHLEIRQARIGSPFNF